MRKIILTGFLAILTLAGCGIKPGSLQPPEGADNTVFPRTYPSPEEKPENGSYQEYHPY
jgi:predicted small lipoprotein YifL